ncbi:hypothetical protein ES705_41189 [subsurface metagenome]
MYVIIIGMCAFVNLTNTPFITLSNRPTTESCVQCQSHVPYIICIYNPFKNVTKYYLV